MSTLILYLQNLIFYEVLLFNFYNNYICLTKTLNNGLCRQYIKNLDIQCITFKKENETKQCEEWEIKKILYIFNFPDECYNKKYILKGIINDSDLLNFEIYIDKEKIIKMKNKELELFKSKKEEIMECLETYNEYLNKCPSKSYNQREQKNCEGYKKHFKISVFCLYTMIDFSNFIENNIDSIKEIGYKNIDDDIYNLTEYYLNNIKMKNIENIYKDIYEHYNNNKHKYYFPKQNQNENEYIIFPNDNKSEKYYFEERKDCIEYGLKSLKEDIIICTKYE